MTSSTGAGIELSASGDTVGGGGQTGGGGEKLDVGSGQASAGAGDCMGGGGGGMEGAAFSLIWIANSPEGTVSKIDTGSGLELARYATGPMQGEDDPSRTSVNLAGDVAVTNRAGGVTKIAAELEDCVDLDGDGVIQTSQGSTDVLPWGSDECVLWHVAIEGDGQRRHGPRPTAWDAGAGGNPCQPGDDRLWVGWLDDNLGAAIFQRLASVDGAVLDEVQIAGWESGNDAFGPYGGAVDAQSNLWVTGLSGPLVRIDGETLAVKTWQTPPNGGPYGLALDANGHPWTAGWSGEIVHFDPDTETFEQFPVPNEILRGLQIDRNGILWAAANDTCGVVAFDTQTLTFVHPLLDLPGCSSPVGVSIDDKGMVWIPDQGADIAYKLDPETLQIDITMGLVAPYTYSDMTGAGLTLVTNPPAG